MYTVGDFFPVQLARTVSAIRTGAFSVRRGGFLGATGFTAIRESGSSQDR